MACRGATVLVARGARREPNGSGPRSLRFPVDRPLPSQAEWSLLQGVYVGAATEVVRDRSARMRPRRTPRLRFELRTTRRTIATRQADLERLGRHEAPDRDTGMHAITQWTAEFVPARQERDRALERYLATHALLALERVRDARGSGSRFPFGFWNERLHALGRRTSDNAENDEGSDGAVVARERRVFRKRLETLPGDPSTLVRAIAVFLVERDLSDEDRTVLAAVLGVPSRATKTACGHCTRRVLGGSRDGIRSTADGIRSCSACEFTMPATERRCASCGQQAFEVGPK